MFCCELFVGIILISWIFFFKCRISRTSRSNATAQTWSHVRGWIPSAGRQQEDRVLFRQRRQRCHRAHQSGDLFGRRWRGRGARRSSEHSSHETWRRQRASASWNTWALARDPADHERQLSILYAEGNFRATRISCEHDERSRQLWTIESNFGRHKGLFDRDKAL